MTLEILETICNECDSKLIIHRVEKRNTTIMISENGTLQGYRNELEKIAEKYNIEDIDGMVIEYIPNSEDYGCCDGGMGVEILADYTKSDKEVLTETIKRFERVMWKRAYDEFMALGYKRTGVYNSIVFKEFDDTSIYEMYKAEEFDRLLKYYLLRFTKID